MNKFIWIFLVIFLACPAIAEQQTLAEAKDQLLQQLQAEGSITEDAAKKARENYILEEDKARIIGDAKNNAIVDANQENSESSWTQYLSLINFIKVLAVILLLVAFSGIIKNLIHRFWELIAKVPVWVYQAGFLAATLYASFFPASISASQFFYIALFGIIGNLILLVWILNWWDKLRDKLIQLLDIGIPLMSIVSFLLTIYFGAFAIAYQSSLLGFFAAVTLSGVFTFSLFYMPGVLFLQFKENALSAMVFGHLIVLIIYVTLLLLGVAGEYLVYFNAGIQYYCTLAMGIGLLVGSSPFYKSASLFYFITFIAVCAAATLIYFFTKLTGMAIILYVLFVLVFLEWIAYLGFKTGVITGLILIGGLLFGLALLLEKYASVILAHFKI